MKGRTGALSAYLCAAALVAVRLSASAAQDARPPEVMRLENLAEVFRMPAPFGLRPQGWEKRLGEALGGTNAAAVAALTTAFADWQDMAARAVNALEEYGEMRSVSRAWSCFEDELYGFDAEGDALRRMFNALELPCDVRERLGAYETHLKDFHARLNAKTGGEALADYGTDLFAWVKNIELGEPRTGFDCQEPTPSHVGMGGGFVLEAEPVGAHVDFVPFRCGSVYKSDRCTYVFSALTQVMGVRTKTDGGFSMVFKSPDGPTMTVLSGSAVTFPGKDGKSLLVIGDRPMKAALNGCRLDVRASAGSCFGLTVIPSGSDALSVADWYRRRLRRLPVRCAQVQRGEKVVQRYLDLEGGPAAFAPICPLVIDSNGSGSPVRLANAEPAKLPDGRWAVLDSNELAYALPERPRRSGIGVNIWDFPDLDDGLYEAVRREGARTIRLTLGVRAGLPAGVRSDFHDPAVLEKLRTALVRNLELARRHGLKVGLDNHDVCHPLGRRETYGGIDDPRFIAEFVRRWSMIIGWAKPYRDILLWYDLWNEPQPSAHPGYWKLMEKALPALRELDGTTPFLVEVTHGANAIGARYWRGLPDSNVILGFHMYQLLMFTHQRQPVGVGWSRSSDLVHYPCWQPLIPTDSTDWRGCGPWVFFDRYMMEGALYPVLERAALTGLPLDCGEFGVIQSARTSPESGSLWMTDAFRALRRIGSSGMIWCRWPHGFVWPVPRFVETVLQEWKSEGVNSK